MNPARLLRWPATLFTAGAATFDEYGDPVAAEVPSLIRVHAFPSTTSEETVNAQVDSVSWTVFLPAGVDADAAARLALDGGPVLELVGAPMPFVSPRTGQVEYQSVPAKVVI